MSDASRPSRTSNAYGFAQAFFEPVDTLGDLLERELARLGVPTARIDRAVGLPAAAEANAIRQAAFRDLDARGVRPGFVGTMAGVAASAPVRGAAAIVNALTSSPSPQAAQYLSTR